MIEIDFNKITDRFLTFEALCREYADANPATAHFFRSLADKFGKDAQRTKRDADVIAESLALLARSALLVQRPHESNVQYAELARPIERPAGESFPDG